MTNMVQKQVHIELKEILQTHTIAMDKKLEAIERAETPLPVMTNMAVRPVRIEQMVILRPLTTDMDKRQEATKGMVTLRLLMTDTAEKQVHSKLIHQVELHNMTATVEKSGVISSLFFNTNKLFFV